MTEYMQPYRMPMELMNLLNEIKASINEVNERVARIEAQDHLDNIKSLRRDIEIARSERNSLQIEFTALKTRIAPILVGVSLVFIAVLDYVFKLKG